MSNPREQKNKITPLYKSRNRRYALFGKKWPNDTITYSIRNYPRITNFSNQEVDSIIEEAFDTWAHHTNLNFEKKPFGEEVNIKISFEDRIHSNKSFDFNFDGPRKVLAHAWPPTIGIVHFDNDETWGFAPEDISLIRIAAHEFGHALGLSHSNVSESLMIFFGHHSNTIELSQDDINGIQKMYGSRLDLCNNASIDAAFMTNSGTIILFKRDWYWEFTRELEMLDGYPKLINDYWKQIPTDIDGAFMYQNKTYFIKERQFWKFINNRLYVGYPRQMVLDQSWNADAIYNKNNEIIVIKNGEKHVISNIHPYYSNEGSLSSLSGISLNDANQVSAACILENGAIYIFSGENYYLLDTNNNQVVVVPDGEPPYPRSIAEHWFGCPNDSV